jgi:hypothetical protein
MRYYEMEVTDIDGARVTHTEVSHVYPTKGGSRPASEGDGG